MSDYDYITPDGECLTDDDMADRYEELITDVYDAVSVGGIEFDAGRVLREMDPIAFRCGVSDYASSEIEDGELDDYRDGHPWLGEED